MPVRAEYHQKANLIDEDSIPDSYTQVFYNKKRKP